MSKRICSICAELSEEIINDHDDWTCKKCGAEYIYDAGVVLEMNSDDWEAIRSNRLKKKCDVCHGTKQMAVIDDGGLAYVKCTHCEMT